MRPLRTWNAFWFAPISARPLGAFRIVFGLLVLANLGFLAFDIDYWFTDLGLLRGGEAGEVAGPFRFSVLHSIRDPLSVRLYFAATAAIAVAVTLGWHARVSSFALYLAMLSIHHRNIVTNSGADVLLLLMCFYLMLSPSGAAFSLDARRKARRRGTAAEPLIVPWAQRLIQLQLCLIYFDTAVLKCNGATWMNGTAMHFVLNNSEVGRPTLGLAWLTEFPVLINLMTHGAVVIECALAFLLWFGATRPWAILAGLSLHVGILLTVNIPIFGELMAACYLCFVSPAELDVLLRLLNPRNWVRRRHQRSMALVIPGRVDPPGTAAGPHVTEIVTARSRSEPAARP